MARYIDADRIDMNQVTVYDYKEQKWTHVFDIPEDIVRCKDCKECEERHTANYLPFLYCKLNEHSVSHNAFCCWAERREDA